MAGSALPFPDGLLGSGLVLGHTTDTTARVWVRCEQAGPHTLTVSAPLGTRSLPVVPDVHCDHLALLELTELQPDQLYSLDLVDSRGCSALAPGLAPQLRTLPREPQRLCFGVMSCSLPFQRAPHGGLQRAAVERVYDDMLAILSAEDARFILNLGDQIYADEMPELNLWELLRQTPEHAQSARARALFFETYRGFWATPALQRLRARIPQYMIWDDHEIRDDWGSRPLREGAEGRLEARLWEAARRGYEGYQHALNPATEAGVYHYSFRVGDSCFFVLDLRGQRSWERGEMLGSRQWHDLTAWLAATAGARARFLVSSVPLHHAPERLIGAATRLLGPGRLAGLVPSTFYDRWCAARFAGELERLVSLLRAPAPGAAPVIVLSGDIHIGAALTLSGGASGVPVEQWISSAATTPSSLPVRLASWLVLRATNLASRWPVRHHFAELRNNFGVVEVDLAADSPHATFHLYAWDGERTVLAHSVSCALHDRRSA